MDDERAQNEDPATTEEQMTESEFERQLEAAEKRIQKIQDETSDIKRGTLKMWQEIERLEKAKRQRALERYRDARNRLERARETSPVCHRASTSTDRQVQSQNTQRQSREKSPQHRETKNTSSKSNKSEERKREIDRDRSPIEDNRSSSTERRKKRRKAQ